MSTLGLAGFVGLTLLAKNLFSSSSSTGEPTGAAQELIEGLVPDYRYVHSIILRLTRINVSPIVTLIMVCLFVIGLVKPCWSEVDRFLVRYFTSAVAHFRQIKGNFTRHEFAPLVSPRYHSEWNWTSPKSYSEAFQCLSQSL
jgi:hypothetical protein